MTQGEIAKRQILGEGKTQGESGEAEAGNEGNAARAAEVYLQVLPVLADLKAMGFNTEKDAETVVRTVLDTNPQAVLEHAQQFKNEPFAHGVLLEAAKRKPEETLRFANNYIDIDNSAEILETAARQLLLTKPAQIFKYVKILATIPNTRELFLEAAKFKSDEVKGDAIAMSVFEHIDEFAEQEWAEEVLLACVENDGAWSAFSYVKKFFDMPFAERVLKAAIPLNSWAALKFLKNYAKAPFAKDLILQLIKGLPQYTPPTEAPNESSRGSQLGLATINSSYLSISDLKQIMEFPFAEEVFTELARINPGLARGFLNNVFWKPDWVKKLVASLREK